MTPEIAAGWSALIAAVATVIGAVTIVLFFAKGGLWGALNDASSVVLMLATIPVAFLVAAIESEVATTMVLAPTAVGIVAMLATAILQALLVGRRVTFEQTKRPVLLLGAAVGLWYLSVAAFASHTALDGLLGWLALISGLGFIAIGYGFLAGGERHPLAAGGGVALLVASTAFLGILGVRLVSGDLVVPDWNL
jgi:hypothetical protein